MNHRCNILHNICVTIYLCEGKFTSCVNLWPNIYINCAKRWKGIKLGCLLSCCLHCRPPETGRIQCGYLLEFNMSQIGLLRVLVEGLCVYWYRVNTSAINVTPTSRLHKASRDRAAPAMAGCEMETILSPAIKDLDNGNLLSLQTQPSIARHPFKTVNVLASFWPRMLDR